LQVSKIGGFIGTLLAELAGSVHPTLLGGKGLVLPGSKGKGFLVLPGSKGKGLSKRKFYYFEKPALGQFNVGPNSPFKNIPILRLIL